MPHLQRKYIISKHQVIKQKFGLFPKQDAQHRSNKHSVLLSNHGRPGTDSHTKDLSAVALEKELLNLCSSVLGNAALRNFFPVNSIGTILGSVVENVFLSYFTGNKSPNSMKRFPRPFESNLVGVLERPSFTVPPLALKDPFHGLLQGPHHLAAVRPIDPVVRISKISQQNPMEPLTVSISSPDSFTNGEDEVDVEVCENKLASSTLHRKVPLPFMNLPTIGISGDWNKVGENYVLYPTTTSSENAIVRPTAVIHFLGAAFVGAAPHMSYRYLLESLGALGYVVVATPYKLDFDYLTTCDSILQQFELAKSDISSRYGEVPPVIGMGHSGGALLQMFLSSFFQEDAKKHGNVFLGINDRPLVDAIPAFQDLIVPLARRVMGTQGPSQTSKSFAFMRKYLETAVGMYSKSSWSPSFFNKDIVPLFQEGLAMVDQVPPLLKSIANGTVTFHPPSQQARDSFRLMYRTKHTLLVKLMNDTCDESIEFERILNEANTIMKMKQSRNLDHMMVDVVQLEGNGYVPFTQSITANISDISSFFKVSGEPLKFCSKSHKSSLISLKEIVKNVDNYIHDIVVPFEDIAPANEKSPNNHMDEIGCGNAVSLVSDIVGDSVVNKNALESTDPVATPVKVTEFATQCNDAVHNITIVTTPVKNAKFLELKKIFDVPALKTSKFVEQLIVPKSNIVDGFSKPSGNMLSSVKRFASFPLNGLALGLQRLLGKSFKGIINQLPTLLQHMIVVAFLYYFPLK